MTVAFAAAALVLAQAAGAPGGGRPSECTSVAGATASNAWERAKSPALRRYCDLLANGAAKLSAGPTADDAREALASAAEAARALPDRTAPTILRGRALVVLGKYAEAVDAFDGVARQAQQELEDPAALFAWGRALGRVGRLSDAEKAFAALLPHVSTLSPAERGKAEIEAGFLASGRGTAGIDQAIALFRQARRDAQDALQVLAGMSLSLALERAGDRDEASVPSGVRQDPRDAMKDVGVRNVLADVGALGEVDSLIAFALRDRDPPGAREAWARYLGGAGGQGVWADHARAMAATGPKGTKRPTGENR